MDAVKSNEFKIRGIYNLGEWVYQWTVILNDKELEGSASTIRQAYRQARKEVKRYCKMQEFLDKACK